MSQDIVLFLEKFSKTITEDQDIKFPFKDKLKKIHGDLDHIQSKIPGKLPQEITNMMRDLLYELDDILQECLKQSNKRKEGKLSLTNIICSPIKSISLQNNLENLENALTNISKKIDEVTPVSSNQPEVNNQTNHAKKAGRPYEWTTSFIDESKIYGWDEDVKKIIDPLIECDSFSVIGIVGMYGCGKTALAQKIFTDQRVKENFPARLWLCVSPSCTHEQLIYRLLDNLGLEKDKVHDIIQKNENTIKIGELLFLLHLQLLGMRYLIVLDDVWDTDDWHRNLTSKSPKDGEWNDRLAFGLPKGNGSAIIVTSRSEEDARRMVETGKIYRPRPLGVEEGWKLFTLAYKEEAKHHNKDKELKSLEAMKENIVKKCSGHPMAIMAAGRGLAREEEP